MWEEFWKPERAAYLAKGGELQRPGQYFSQLATKTADAGNILWAHNVHFDVTGWASQHMSPQAMGTFAEAAVVPPWYPVDPRRGKIYPTLTSKAWKYRRRAREFPRTAAGQMRGFYGEFRTTVSEAVRTGKPMIADTMFVAQSMMGMAQGQRYMPATGDVFTGVGLESLHQAFFRKGYQAHMAAADVEAMGRLMPELVGTAEALYAGAPLRGRQAAALYRLGAMQPGIAEKNVTRTFAEAQQQLRDTGRYALSGERGAQIFSRDYGDIQRIYEKRYGELAYRDFPSIKGIAKRVGGMADTEIAAMLAEKELPALGRGARMGAGAAFAKAEISHFLRNTNPMLLTAMGVAAGGALLYGLMPDRKESNTIEGLREEGLAGYNRKFMTDFGSGWRGLVSVPARWMASAGEASAEFITKSGLAEHISNLKNDLKIAETMAKMGAEMKGSLNEVEMLELRQTIEKLGTMSGRKQGGILVAAEELASTDPHRLSRIKALISEERFHEAVANSKYMRDIIGKEGAVPMEWLMSMEAQSYGVPKDVRDGLRAMTEAEQAHVRFGWREEYFAKMSAMEVAGESMAIEDYLALDQYAGDRNFELLQRHAKRYRAGVIGQNVRHYKHSQQIKAARMTTKTMERYAPLPLSGIRMFDSPGVPGMVQRIHGARKGSAKMYNH